MTSRFVTGGSAWPSLTFEGNLIAAAKIEEISNSNDNAEMRASYCVRKGLTVRDEILDSFRIARHHFDSFDRMQGKSIEATRCFIHNLLKETFGFDDLIGKKCAVAFTCGNQTPIVVALPCEQNLDRHNQTLSTKRFHSHAFILQNYLNEHDDALWGLVTNGVLIRLMRRNTSLTRPAYIEANLDQIFRNEDTASFTVLWLMIHRSRFGIAGMPAVDCCLEHWRKDGLRKGEAARDRLANQVRRTLEILGSGFLEANPDLVKKVNSSDANLKDWFNELLRLVYRLIFLMVAEDRELLHSKDDRRKARKARELYKEGYSLSMLRDRCYRAASWDNHFDCFEGVKIVFRSLSHGEARLALPALGGLFSEDKLLCFETLHLRNKALMEGLYRLSFLDGYKAGKVRVNWRSMETEELGSVYESLLELQPRLYNGGKGLKFASRGNQRKTTGSYYTPNNLVQALLDTTLEPLLQERMNGDDAVESLLKLSVIDPACGSGHFLLAAARRIAARVANARCDRNDEVQMSSVSDFRHALREVSRRCIYGVDKNSMAIELTKVALWIETIDPGLPLGFFDSQIRCGDSLLGIFDREDLLKGIPDNAYNVMKDKNDEGIEDSEIVARDYLRANRASKDKQGELDFASGVSELSGAFLVKSFAGLRELPEGTVEEIDAKEQCFDELREDGNFVRLRKAADLYVGAFLLPKKESGLGASSRSVPISGDVWTMLEKGLCSPLLEKGIDLARRTGVFHWPLEFPDVMQNGGFDVVLGNPPWEKYTLLEREFFANIEEIATEANSAKRDKMIKAKLKDSPTLKQAWDNARREAFAKVAFARGSGRFPQTAVGDLNLCPLFAELGISITKKSGWTGMVLKSSMFTGSTWKNFANDLISSGKLHSLFNFKNSERLFSAVHSNERYSLATIGPIQPESRIRLAVSLTNPSQLSEDNSVVDIDRAFPQRVNPETKTLPQCETLKDLRILSRIVDSLPTLEQSNWNVRYSRGLDMKADADKLRRLEDLEEEGFELKGSWLMGKDTKYAPVCEGKLIHQYDHRFATFRGTSAEKRFNRSASTINPTKEQKAQRDFEIVPRYWVHQQFFEDDTSTRDINFSWNFTFRTITDVTSNFRTAVGCIVGPTAFSYACPNIVIEKGDPVASALFLSMFNSVPYDYLLRQKFYGINFTKSLLMQSFVVSKETVTPYKTKLLDTVASLTNTSDSVKGFCDELNRGDMCVNDMKERLERRAWVDALYLHLFGFEADDIDYVFETFTIWKSKSVNSWGSFLHKERTIALFSELEPNIKK